MLDATPNETMFSEALDAIHKGEKVRAKDLLTRLLKLEPNSARYWLWMSSVVDSRRERIFCLQSALQNDPTSQQARQGLTMLGAMPPDEAAIKQGLVRRNWQSVQAEKDKQDLPKPAWFKIAIPAAAAVLVIALIVMAILGVGKPRRAAVARIPAATLRATATLLPTTTPVVRSATPTFTGPTPLWMQLAATYTPTPLYVATSHPRTEAYRTGLNRYNRGDWAAAITFFEQVITSEPDAADVYYYIGESQRQMGQYSLALASYNDAISKNPAVASAYLGRARARLAADPAADVLADLQEAVSRDPNLIEAYLELARVELAQDEPEAALEALDKAAAIADIAPQIPLYRAQAHLLLDEPEQAIEQALLANERDFTMLPVYLTLGEAYQAAGMMYESLKPLETYTAYISNDATAQLLLGKAYYDSEQYEQAQQAFTRALTLNDRMMDAYLLRGAIFLDQQDGKKALSDFAQATKLNFKSFDGLIGLGRSYLLLDYKQDGLNQINKAAALAESEAQKAVLYYWRATALEAAASPGLAAKDWAALLELPAEIVPSEWARDAQEHIEARYTPTPNPTATRTPLPKTATPTRKP